MNHTDLDLSLLIARPRRGASRRTQAGRRRRSRAPATLSSAYATPTAYSVYAPGRNFATLRTGLTAGRKTLVTLTVVNGQADSAVGEAIAAHGFRRPVRRMRPMPVKPATGGQHRRGGVKRKVEGRQERLRPMWRPWRPSMNSSTEVYT